MVKRGLFLQVGSFLENNKVLVMMVVDGEGTDEDIRGQAV